MKLALFTLFVLLNFSLLGQELNCNVIIDDERVQTQERNIFKQMQRDITTFLNSRKWTQDVYEPEERISCNVVITLLEMPSYGNFTATAQIQSTRPVYGTDYESLLFNFVDKNFNFTYRESKPLEYSDNAFINNLTSMLAFYTYMILGYDGDSYARRGGTNFFEKALNVVNNAQGAPQSGWRQDENQFNRYWLSDNLNSPQFIQFRESIYTYHFQGMDHFASNPDQARGQILSALNRIKQVNKLKPNSVAVRTFFDSKADELINIFSEGILSVRQNAVKILEELDPLRSNRYRKALRN